jgi:hypothetical protein
VARYTVHAPADTGHYIGAALTPNMTRPAVGWSSRGRVTGHPGTLGIPISGPEALHRSTNDLANVGIYRSTDTPNVIFPPIYYENGNAYGDKERAPVSRISDNQMPIPALRPPNVLVFDAYQARQGGQRQVYQPQVIQQWRGMKGTSNG